MPKRPKARLAACRVTKTIGRSSSETQTAATSTRWNASYRIFYSATTHHRSTIMAEIRGYESETTGSFLTSVSSVSSSERDQAHGVTLWMISNFGSQLADAVRSTPFSVPLLCAIA
jgi:hypothetical protein